VFVVAGVAERLGEIDHRDDGGEVVVEAALAPQAVVDYVFSANCPQTA
jgi:hypothetical protein